MLTCYISDTQNKLRTQLMNLELVCPNIFRVSSTPSYDTGKHLELHQLQIRVPDSVQIVPGLNFCPEHSKAWEEWKTQSCSGTYGT